MISSMEPMMKIVHISYMLNLRIYFELDYYIYVYVVNYIVC